MKRVLLLGDSIRMGYQAGVQQRLRDAAEVVAPEENGRFATYTFWGLHLWIAELGRPDIVHWNNGLWDVHHEAPREDALTLLDEYVATLERTIGELRRIGATIIFATTTPVAPASIDRSNDEIDRYNAAAIDLMRRHAIEINDLNRLVRQDLAANLSDDQVHLSAQGYDRCAGQVAAIIRRHL